MKKLILAAAFMAILAIPAVAQRGPVSGSLVDTSDNRSLQHAVISLIRKSDSTLMHFARSDESGKFILPLVDTGTYILLVTYPQYADYADVLAVNTSSSRQLKPIILTPKSQLLEEVIVRQGIAAIRMKGDTLEFRADSFAVREGANVEELLKKLPGIQVNRNGEITAQGERVQKVLVDGEEFFSDDPAVVTQNLRADAVENVQVFDKKSDQATFTGIDDGEKTKTINLKLKEDRKTGVFGKAKVAGGTPGWFENEAMINAFKGKRKVAAFGTMSNTGKAGLNWQDNDRFGGGDNVQYNEEEGYFYSFAQSDEFNTYGGRYNGEGLPTAWTGGVHYSNKWNSDKNHVNGNYRYYKQNIEIGGSTISQFILPDSQYFNDEQRYTYNQNIRHSLNGFYDMQLDSSSNVKLYVSGQQTMGRSLARYEGQSLNEDSALVNDNSRLLNSDGDRTQFNTNLIWRKKLAKAGRTISLSVDQLLNENETDGLLQSRIDYYNLVGLVDSSQLVDQKKLNSFRTMSINSRIAYTEPITSTTFLEVNYGYRISNSEALRNSFNRSPGAEGKYDILDSLFSNDYRFRFNTHSTGLNLRVNKKKLTYSFGSNVSLADFTQTDLNADTAYRYSFVNLFPRASFRYNFTSQRRVQVNYNGSTRQPTLEQIQPVFDNANPLNVQVGNPNLKQEFRHNVSFFVSDYKVLSSRSIYLNGNIAYTENAISTSTFIDKGVRTTQFVNVSGNQTMNAWLGYYLQLRKVKLNVGFNGGLTASRFNNFVDGRQNTNTNRSMNASISIFHDKEKKYSLYVNPAISMNYSRSSLNPDIVTRFWTSDSHVGGNLFLPAKFEAGTDAALNFRQKTEVFNRDVNAIRWNAFLAKKFWKNNAGEFRLSVFDILDQNIGLQRNATSNFITENSYNTIRRYWLASFTWNFNWSSAGTPSNQ